jgi:hypothetical protein
MMRIYLTHCSKEKNDSLQGVEKTATPDKLYVAAPIQDFMNRCLEKEVNWAILSDLYGVWFSEVEHQWYEKHPSTVTEEEYQKILKNFDQSLKLYDEIWFYVRPETFHSFYERVLTNTALKDKVKHFTDLKQIG